MDIIKDTNDFISKFEINQVPIVNGKPDPKVMVELWDARVSHLYEELDELLNSETPEDAIDALVDLVYIAVGTANLFGFDFDKHWDEVHKANMAKIKGTTKRGHSFDVKKPEGWQEPNHKDILYGRK